MELVAGAKVAGKYELERRIGVGGMGEVWSAVQSPTRKRVALKFLKPAKDESKAETDATHKRFLREARAACAVQHPNVVAIHDVLTLDDGAPVMVMEFLSGETLEAKLAREGRVALGEVAAVLVRVVSAVGAAHALGIVHRDLKPDNVFLAETGDGVDVKVLDFGIAKLTALDGDAAQTGGLTNTGAMLGTPYYMSPEQAFGERNIDHRADIWSLGIILYRAITGILPTRADNIGQILKVIMMGEIKPIESVAPEVPADIVALVGRMLSPKREDRPASLLDVKVVLERYAGVEVAGFGAPAARHPSASSLAVTGAAALPATATLGAEQSMGGVARGTTRPAPRSSLVWGLGGGVALAAIVGLALVLQGRGASSATGQAGASTTEAQPTGAAASTPAASSAGPAPAASVAPAASSASAPEASSAPSLAAPATSSSTASSSRAPGPLPRAKPAATPAAPAAGAPRPETTSVGGVITAPPQF